MSPKDISISDYTYNLPENKIALHPLLERDLSKLLVYKNGQLYETVFKKINEHLAEKTLMVFNDTKVINARILFAKSTGSKIEIFCLEPYELMANYQLIMASTKPVQWKCFVGGAAKWKEEILQKEVIISKQKINVFAKKIAQQNDTFIIEFYWQNTSITFAEIIAAAGSIPLPPYIKRNINNQDANRYQTIYANHSGSVAAPTAGLHFTQNVFAHLAKKNIESAFVTLHVGAGTFKPVKAHTMEQHQMHAEYISVTKKTIEHLLKNIGRIAAVGTTSLRTLESLYWFGVKVCVAKSAVNLTLTQWEVYEPTLANTHLTATEALTALLQWMQLKNIDNIFTQTQILIAPTYQFKIANMLVTNFHQPKSTLLLIIAAAVGYNWVKMYDYALQNNFRFLSYGDANLIYL